MKISFVTAIISVFLFSTSPVLSMNDPNDEGKTVAKKQTPKKRTLFPSQKAVNKHVIPVAKRVFKSMDANWIYAPPKTHIKTGSKFWEPKIISLPFLNGEKRVDRKIYSLVLKTDPENTIIALKDIIENPASVECIIASNIAQIFCIIELVGEDNFIEYATVLYNSLKDDPTRSVDEFFTLLPNAFIDRIPNMEPVPGVFTYAPNIPLYAVYKPNGNAAGDNLFCAEKGFLRFNPSDRGEHVSLDTVRKTLYEEFIKTSDGEEFKDEHRLLASICTMQSKVFYNLLKVDEKSNKTCDIFCLRKINSFIQQCNSRAEARK